MGGLTKYGQYLLAKYMYQKGKEFIGAAILLKQAGGYTHVYTHLICQGLELTLKSLLLFKDYNKFRNVIKTKLKHDLIKLVDTWKIEINHNRVKVSFCKEIKILNEFYKSHGLRYGSLTDILIHPVTIATQETLKQLKITIEKTDIKLKADAAQHKATRRDHTKAAR